MRLELAGYFSKLDPFVVTFVSNQNFDISPYLDLGYTNFDVICIGAAGGMGGGINTNNTGTKIRSYGGAGGGGGYHRVKGLLSVLPTLIPIVVGVGGSGGTEHSSDPAFTTDGGDGGYSSFNGATCRASGGKGGKRVDVNSITVKPDSQGGMGGIGDSITAGGGANGGISQGSQNPDPAWNGSDGLLAGNIGKGGGGGCGGVGKWDQPGFILWYAGSGGRGSYNVGDLSVYGPEDPTRDYGSMKNIVPGGGGGAKATPLNKLPKVYGSAQYLGTVAERIANASGVVVVRITAE